MLFQELTRNPVCILASSALTYYYNILYNRVSNKLHQGSDVGNIANFDHSSRSNTNRITPPPDWYKWKTDASRRDCMA